MNFVVRGSNFITWMNFDPTTRGIAEAPRTSTPPLM